MKGLWMAPRRAFGLGMAWLALSAASVPAQQTPAAWQPQIPKMWVDAEMAGLEVPLATMMCQPVSGAPG